MKNIKRLMTAVIIAAVAFALAGCSNNKVQYEYEDAEKEQFEAAAMSYMEGIISMDDETLDMYIEDSEYQQNEVMTNGYNSWKSGKADLGEYVDIKTIESSRDKDSGAYKCTIMAEFEQRDCEFILATDRKMGKITELTFNPVYTLKEKLGQAGINLLMGMGTVFAVLIFLTWIISLFKYIGKAQEKMDQKKGRAGITETAAKAPAAKAETASANAANATSNEIQAVIAAAIAAYEAECGSIVKQPALNNGVVIRSYKRK